MRRFINRRFVTVTALAAALALAGATGADAQLERVIDPDWTLPRTADGQPDLQGLWTNSTTTPLELETKKAPRPRRAGGLVGGLSLIHI